MNHNPTLMDALTREGVLLSVTVRYWRATKKLRPEELGLKADDVSARLIRLGHKRLLPQEALSRLALIEGRAHYLVDSFTFPFMGGVARYLPNRKLAAVTAALEALKVEFEAEAARFTAQYDQLRSQALVEWRAAVQKLSSQPDRVLASITQAFPPSQKLERYFGFQVYLFQVTVPEALPTTQLVELGDQLKIEEARQQIAREAQTHLKAETERFVADCVGVLRTETAQLCDDMLEAINGGKTDGVHQKTLNRLLRFIERFHQLNFAGDDEMERLLETARRELLNRSADTYRHNSAATRQLQVGLTRLRDTARELAQGNARELVERFGRIGDRKFHLAA